MLISLDVQNAFNTASLPEKDEALRRKGLSRRLIATLRSYVSEREILVPVDGGEAENLTVSAGVPQSSVLGLALWNILYDDMLRLNLPTGVDLIAYADDVAIIALSRSVPELKAIVRTTMNRVSTCMVVPGLKLAPHKTEAVMMIKRRYDDLPTIVVDGQAVLPTRGIKYLGVRVDTNKHFSNHFSGEEGGVGGACGVQADA